MFFIRFKITLSIIVLVFRGRPPSDTSTPLQHNLRYFDTVALETLRAKHTTLIDFPLLHIEINFLTWLLLRIFGIVEYQLINANKLSPIVLISNCFRCAKVQNSNFLKLVAKLFKGFFHLNSPTRSSFCSKIKIMNNHCI